MNWTSEEWSRAWGGRDDGPDPASARMHQRIRPIDLDRVASLARGSIVIVGYPNEQGVRTNKGRGGAAAGPKAIRRAMGSLPCHWPVEFYDLGDVADKDAPTATVQAKVAEAVSAIAAAGGRPLVLGGGHDVAFGTWQGVAESVKPSRSGVLSINIDAHLDNRQLGMDSNGRPLPSSGTSYTQMQDWCAAQDVPFRAIALGIQRMSNTRLLLERAQASGYQIAWRDEVVTGACRELLASALNAPGAIHLTIDLDALAMSVAPGVSAPNGAGLQVVDIVQLLDMVPWGRVAAVDIAELAPGLDAEERTARAAAAIVFEVLERWARP